MRKRISKGMVWTGVNLVVNKGLSLFVKLVLARLLLPEQFGLVSMVLVGSGFLSIFADLGIQKALIQRKRDKGSLLRYDSAFWFLTITGGLMVAFMWVVGVPFLVWFYQEPLLAPIAMALSFSIWAKALSTIPQVRLTRVMQFRLLVLAEMVGVMTASIAAIGLALAGAGVWSLVAKTLVASLVTLMLLWRFAAWRPRWRFNLAVLYDVRGFSVYTLANSTLFFLRKHMDVILVGKLLGASALGFYTLAFTLTEVMRLQIYAVVNKVLFPVYSRLQDDPSAIKPYYMAVVRYTTLATFPFAMLLILYADLLIPSLFTETWSEAIAPVQILALASMIFSMSGAPAEVLKGLGKPQVAFRISFLNTTFVALPAIWLGTLWFGLQGAAWGVVLHYTASRIAHHAAMRREISVREHDIMFALLPASAGSCAMLLPWWLELNGLGWEWRALMSIACYAALAVPVFFLFSEKSGRHKSKTALIMGGGKAQKR
ncbi:lipopolysaccharide biosynthesis protein [Halomonas heilongjiangensis]|uniref:Uncharacterized protein n=1 Tax=Halomonas heilongjiangensis TaxID=1387883 RepID=A0A2N7TUK3_9GAMM|nr:lipopolysaccharide biosynthesis protein [Halomonas heilongjiangensis]PMR71872.1 hypothetical protein C1H66_01115 [Halomonas heilongjiangensis]PXX87664.1 hypothetical protein CR158_17835 [Halomonas heilongjiangensis]